MWTYDQLLPAKPKSGAVKGHVTRGVQTSAGVDYVGIPGVLVRGRDQGGTPLISSAAITQADGSYALLDARYTGGPVTVQATYNGKTLTGSGYEANPQDDSMPAPLRAYPNVAIADITFPPEPPQAPPPQILIQVVKLVNGQRQDTQGLVAADTPVLFGLKTNLTIQSATVQSGAAGSQALSVRGPLTADPSGYNYTAEDPSGAGGMFTPTQSGTYTISTTGVPAFGPPVTQTLTFRVTGAGGGVDTVPGAPAVITARTAPKANATGVPVDVLPQVAFTEPVKNVLGNIALSELDGNGAVVGSVPVTLLGVAPNGQPVTVTGPDVVVTSLTLQPSTGLKFSTKYRISLTSAIVDLDSPTPSNLVPYDTDFTTFGPATVGSGGTTASPGIVILGNRAYLVQNAFLAGQLQAWDIDDPVNPTQIEFDATTSPGQTMEQATMSGVAGRPVDIAGESDSPLGSRVVVIATSSTNQSKPSNLDVFDVSDDTHPHWIGAASVAGSATEGTLVKVKVVNGKAYTITSHKGLQVVDLQQAVTNLQQATNNQAYSRGYWDMVRQLGTDGQGFGQDAVEVTIPVNQPNGKSYYLTDLEVANLLLDNVAQPLMLATGQLGLAIGGAIQPGSPVFAGNLEDATGKLTYGQAIGYAHIGDRDIAAIAGSGFVKNAGGTQTPGLVFASVDVTDPKRPAVLRFVLLDGGNPAASATDLIIKGNLALVATATDVRLVSLADPTNPVVAGVLQGLGGILALSDTNMIFSTTKNVFGGSDPGNGVHNATLGTLAVIRNITSADVVADSKGTSTTDGDIAVGFAVYPVTYQIGQAQVLIHRDGSLIATLPTVTSGSAGRAVWSAGQVVNLDSAYTAQVVIEPGAPGVFSSPQVVPLTRWKVDVQVQSPYVLTNINDDNLNGIPDFADGYRRTGSNPKTDPTPTKHFLPLTVQFVDDRRP